jgi:hypothetical protein
MFSKLSLLLLLTLGFLGAAYFYKPYLEVLPFADATSSTKNSNPDGKDRAGQQRSSSHVPRSQVCRWWSGLMVL